MNYTTYPPHPDLDSFIKCYWLLEAPSEAVPEKQRIVPDGCMEMIFHYADPFKQYLADGSSIIQPSCFVFGQITTTLEIEPTGNAGIIAARFHPDGFLPFATIPVREMENRAVSLEELFGEEGKQLGLSVLKAETTSARIHLMETFFLAKLQTEESIDRIARASVEALLLANGQVTIDELADQLNINRRQLERRFAAVIGMSPKQLSKIIRLQATLKLMEQKQFTSLTSLAYETGYFDQAHFIKDFKEFTGVSPRDFYSGNLKMSSLFSGSE